MKIAILQYVFADASHLLRRNARKEIIWPLALSRFVFPERAQHWIRIPAV
jgi:hypothetical protein